MKEENLVTNVISGSILQSEGFYVNILNVLKFVLLLPVYFLGLITNYIPYIFTAKIFNSLKLDIEYKAPVQMITGFFTYPVYYALIIWLFRLFISSEFWYSLLLFILMPISGYLALYYYTELRRFLKKLYFDFFIPKHKKEIIINLKDEILENMEEARNYALDAS